MNFIPKMNKNDLEAGFTEVIKGIYGGKPYYERVRSFLQDFQSSNYSDISDKTLILNKEESGWKIIGIKRVRVILIDYK